MITLEDLKHAEGSTKKSKRVGRGRASGHGKTSCRGHNGEGQRSGRSSKRGFEGGQMPAYRKMPKLKGFKLINQIKYAEINVVRSEEHTSELKSHSEISTAVFCLKKLTHEAEQYT